MFIPFRGSSPQINYVLCKEALSFLHTEVLLSSFTEWLNVLNVLGDEEQVPSIHFLHAMHHVIYMPQLYGLLSDHLAKLKRSKVQLVSYGQCFNPLIMFGRPFLLLFRLC